jgi:hypothetical protein
VLSKGIASVYRIRFGYSKIAPVYRIRFGYSKIAPVYRIRFGYSKIAPVYRIRFGYSKIAPVYRIRFGYSKIAPVYRIRFGYSKIDSSCWFSALFTDSHQQLQQPKLLYHTSWAATNESPSDPFSQTQVAERHSFISAVRLLIGGKFFSFSETYIAPSLLQNETPTSTPNIQPTKKKKKQSRKITAAPPVVVNSLNELGIRRLGSSVFCCRIISLQPISSEAHHERFRLHRQHQHQHHSQQRNRIFAISKRRR